MNDRGLSSALQVRESADLASRELAGYIAQGIRKRADQSKSYVLGLATGSSPLPLYRELVRLHREEALSFRNVTHFQP